MPPAEAWPPADRAGDVLKFLGGGALAFVIHEGSHLTFDEIFDAHPRLKSVRFGPFPFFAITPGRPISSRQLFTVASAGIWSQDLTAELL